MPAKRGRRGNSSRGSRVSSRGNGRFRTNNSKKRKSKGTSNNHRPANKDVPELMDLGPGVYLPEFGANSMRTLLKRPGRSMISEALYTGAHMDETMRLPMRKRPVEFVKAKEVYDPSKDLQKKFEKVSIEESEEIDEIEDVENIEIESEAEEIEEKIDEEVEKTEEMEETDEKEETDEIEQTDDVSESVEKEHPGSKSRSTVEPVEFVIDENGDDAIDVSEIPKPKAALLQEASCIEHDDIITIGKVSLQTRTNADGELETELMAIDHLNKVARPGFVDEGNPTLESDSDDDVNDPRGYQDYINQVMQQMRDESDFDDDEYESETNFDIMASSSENESPEDESVREDSDREPEELEYGFLEEDYEFDVSRISVSNMRLGIKCQYYTSCVDLNGSTEPVWLDEDEIKDFVLANGVKEHRLACFFKFLTKHLIPEKDEEPSVSDVYISETSDSEVDYGDEESLGDLLEWAKNKPHAPEDIDLDPTHTIRTKGKGNKKNLDLDSFDMDSELRQSLQEQYLSQREAKKMRKKAKEQEATDEGIASNDLFIKYPYTLHIKDIRDEMETFLHDSTRSRLKFPPLDPHGNKTVSKMAECFNFKCKRAGGNGTHLFMEAVKNKRTFQYIPNYNRIYTILRQRPVFNRIDQKRPKDEIVTRDGNRDKDRRRGRDKGSNANVREGDIVGEKAPEIDASNIGRKLLESMGWSKGQGLGAIGNQGINEPVVAKVKMSKLGLK